MPQIRSAQPTPAALIDRLATRALRALHRLRPPLPRRAFFTFR